MNQTVPHSDGSFSTVDDGDVFAQNSNDYTDYLAADKRRRTTWTIISAVLILVAAAAAILVTMNILSSDAEKNTITEEDTVTLPVTQTDGGATTPSPSSTFNGSDEDRNMVLAEALEVSPNVSPGQVALYYGSESISTSDANTVSFRGFSVDEPSTKCSVISAEEFCYAGKIDQKDGAGSFHSYLMKDLAHSRFFDDAKNLELTAAGNGSSVATAQINFRGSTTNVVAVVFDDNSGIMVAPEGSDDGTRIEAVKNSLLVTAGTSAPKSTSSASPSPSATESE